MLWKILFRSRSFSACSVLFRSGSSFVEISTVGRVPRYCIPRDVGTRLQHEIIKLCQNNSTHLWIEDPALYEGKIQAIRQEAKLVVMDILPASILSSLETFRDLSDPQMLLIKQFPFAGDDACEAVKCLLLGISAVMKMKPFAYRNEHNGRLMHHIRSNIQLEYSPTALGSRTPLNLHVENAFDPNRPDMLGLYCLTGDSAAKTTFYSVVKMYENVDENLRQRLTSVGMEEEEFLFQHPKSHSTGRIGKGALFFDTADGRKATRYATAYTRGQTERAQTLTTDLQTVH